MSRADNYTSICCKLLKKINCVNHVENMIDSCYHNCGWRLELIVIV